MNVLTVNVGSSSLKLSLIGPDDSTLDTHVIERWESGDTGLIGPFLERSGPVDAVAHRIVHGGERYTSPTVIDEEVVSGIAALADLAPLHQPRALAGIHAARQLLKSKPQVACFDTAFHSGLPEAARTYALPEDWRLRWPVRRFGFHGLSHAYASHRAPQIAGSDLARMVSCHLGSGASLCAIKDGRSVDTTMGFTPLEGLVMGTRSGTVDPGLILWLMQSGGLEPAEVSDGLEHRSGLAGLSGGKTDMRDILAATSDSRSRLAFDVFIHRLVALVASMTAALGGIDGLIFTGGIGENSPEVRRAAVSRLAFLGAGLDEAVNNEIKPDGNISAPGTSAQVLVVAAREDIQMARETRRLLT